MVAGLVFGWLMFFLEGLFFFDCEGWRPHGLLVVGVVDVFDQPVAMAQGGVMARSGFQYWYECTLVRYGVPGLAEADAVSGHVGQLFCVLSVELEGFDP